MPKTKQSEEEKKEKRRIRQRLAREKNREPSRQYSRKYYAKNKIKIAERKKNKRMDKPKDKPKTSPMERLVAAYIAKRSLRLTADEVQNLVDRDGGLSNIAEMFNPDNIDHEEFMQNGLHIMRGEEQPLKSADAVNMKK
jgi:hypothetical protein